MESIYRSWLKRTCHITQNCTYCRNKRYTFSFPITTDRSNEFKPTIYACPACNFEDLQIAKKTDYLPLEKFVMVKNGLLNISDLN